MKATRYANRSATVTGLSLNNFTVHSPGSAKCYVIYYRPLTSVCDVILDPAYAMPVEYGFTHGDGDSILLT